MVRHRDSRDSPLFCLTVVVLLSASLFSRSLRSFGKRWKGQTRVSQQHRARVKTPYTICGILCWIYFSMCRSTMYLSPSTMTLTSRGLPCLATLPWTYSVAKHWIRCPASLPDAFPFFSVYGTMATTGSLVFRTPAI